MGRNGKKAPVFAQIIQFVNNNVGNTVKSNEILLGSKPNRGAATAYLYKFIKMGHVKQVSGQSVQDPEATYEILKAFPPGYNSQIMKQELKAINELNDLL